MFHAGCHRKRKPHPCGYYGDSKRQCRCSTRQIENYRQKISGPLLDRIDLHVEVPLVDFRELSSNTNVGEKSETIRNRVSAAREIQTRRFKKNPNPTNSAMGSRLVRQHCQLSAESNRYLEHAMEEMNFSARAHDRILKVPAPSPTYQDPPTSARMTSWKPFNTARWTGSCFRDHSESQWCP